ncbi:hypothetical protein MLD38_004263 [Melastoma candidum]|uniref:Uncharacterized protein n=1 Tax=Melastoma candidum TaxID=119954 RepID=A0ACB9S534_9MYRT|nr:hypothetical protein MLD38_004263 [Melastoma candidum]
MAAAATSAPPDQPPLLTVVEVPGKGRCLVAAQPLVAGQVILRESPILLYPDSPFPYPRPPPYCAHCFRCFPLSPPSILWCQYCYGRAFCGMSCADIAHASSHSSYVCRSLAVLSRSPLVLQLPRDRQVQARFLVAAYNLAVVSPPAFQTLLSLHGINPPDQDTMSTAMSLHPLIASLCPPPVEAFSVELTAALLSKDKVNAFGLMGNPSAYGAGSGSPNAERSVRAYGIYPRASLFNHDCLPNACRFDYVDGGKREVADNNTDVIIRMIHDVPAGREICLSYFPVNWSYSSRQKRLREDYGFVCECDRCKIEANWSDNENEIGNDGDTSPHDEMDDGDEEEAGDECDVEEEVDGGNDFPHAYFFAMYMCERQNCGGTLAPLPPSPDGQPSSTMECNVCGLLKNADEDLGSADKDDMDE